MTGLTTAPTRRSEHGYSACCARLIPIRSAIGSDLATRGNRAALDRLAAETDLTTVPPDLFVLYMQMRGGAWPQAREQIGVVATRNRDHFWVQAEAAYYYTVKEPRAAEAAGYLRAALAIRPDNRYALTFLGVQLRKLHDLDGAAAVYREAIRLDPTPADTHFNLGIVLKDKGDARGAAEAFRASIAASRRTPTPTSSLPHAC